MSGGLSHHTDEEDGPSHTVGHELSKQQGCYSLERNQRVCADVIRVPANYKNKPTPLDMNDVVRDVENRWDENAGLRRDAISSQLSTRSRRKEIKETGNEED